MYPLQRLEQAHEPGEIYHSYNEIIQVARDIVSAGKTERDFIVFPLLTAGVVAHTPAERGEVIALLQAMERNNSGRHILMTRDLLANYFEKAKTTVKHEDASSHMDINIPHESALSGTNQVQQIQVKDIDWIALIGELGLHGVNFRL